METSIFLLLLLLQREKSLEI